MPYPPQATSQGRQQPVRRMNDAAWRLQCPRTAAAVHPSVSCRSSADILCQPPARGSDDQPPEAGRATAPNIWIANQPGESGARVPSPSGGGALTGRGVCLDVNSVQFSDVRPVGFHCDSQARDAVRRNHGLPAQEL